MMLVFCRKRPIELARPRVSSGLAGLTSIVRVLVVLASVSGFPRGALAA